MMSFSILKVEVCCWFIKSKSFTLGCGVKTFKWNLRTYHNKECESYLEKLVELFCWPLTLMQVVLTLLVSAEHENQLCVLSVSTICSGNTNSSLDNDSGTIHRAENKRMGSNSLFAICALITQWNINQWLLWTFLLEQMQRSFNVLSAALQTRRSWPGLLRGQHPYPAAGLKACDIWTTQRLCPCVCFSRFIPYRGKCWLCNRNQIQYSKSEQALKKNAGVLLTDIMSSLCHPLCKSPWSIIKGNHCKAYMHWLLIGKKRHVYLSPLHEELQEDREAQWKREHTCQSDHVSFSTSFQGNSRDSSNCL